jgi:hypothetical protein
LCCLREIGWPRALLCSFMAIFSSWSTWILTVMFVNSGLDWVSSLSCIRCATYAGDANYAWHFEGQVIFVRTE